PRPFGGFVAKACIVAQGGRLGQLPGGERGYHFEGGCVGHSGGNGDADKAMLDYMVKHWPRPWVWVSDGGVEAETQGNWKSCDEICARFKIVRVRTIEDAIEFLGGKAVQAWTQIHGRPRRMRRGEPLTQEETSAATRW